MTGDKNIEKRENPEGFAASVELPEGHQLVIGELPPGTIVEVATWQGTGRPDETTNRFLLSASGSGLQRRGAATERTSPAEIEAPTGVESIEPVSASSLSIGSIGAAGSKVEARKRGSEVGEISPVKHSRWKRIAQGAFTFISIIAISCVVLSLAGISVVVPERGAKTALGPSTSALVIYKKSPSVQIGTPTVALTIINGKSGYIFGPSNSFDEKTIQIETTAGQELVETKNISGRAFLAIPLIGTLVKPFIQ
jgi:hypothetical protein